LSWFEEGRQNATLPRLGSRVRIPSPAPVSHPPNILRRISSREKASFRAVLRVKLGVRGPERYGKPLSDRPSLSEAWGLTDLLYKLFPQRFQCKPIFKPPRSCGFMRFTQTAMQTFASAPG
jgi:hypothetical protein